MVRAPRGNQINCKGWLQEAALRMLMNNLDPEGAEMFPMYIIYTHLYTYITHMS